MIEHLNNVVSYNDYDSDLMETKYDDLIDINDLSNIFNSDLINITNFEPIVMNSGVYKFLINRGIDVNLQKIFIRLNIGKMKMNTNGLLLC